MADKPIIFSGPMVHALLDGHKTQTRRVLKQQPVAHDVRPNGFFGITNTFSFTLCDSGGANSTMAVPVGYQVGDRLWVRERWSGNHAFRNTPPSRRISFVGEGVPFIRDEIWYWADGSPEYGDWEKPRRSIHMPRWASRLTLTVTDVRVQRVQEISEADAKAEGIGHSYTLLHADNWQDYRHPAGAWLSDPRDSFSTLWGSLHGPEAWDANPWVVCLSFQTHRKNIDEMEVEDVTTD